jgi:predicted histidine transporter YuiF (NhaC family)
MMQQQLNQHKQETCGLYSLRAAVKSMNEILDRKVKIRNFLCFHRVIADSNAKVLACMQTNECKDLAEKVAGQSKEIAAMNEEVLLVVRFHLFLQN